MRPLFWINNARYVSFPQSLIPAVLAVVLAYGQGDFMWLPAILAVIGCVSAHFGFNLLDDYFDFKTNDGHVREQLADMGFRSRIAKCDYLTSGQATLKQTRNAIIFFLGIATLCGIAVLALRNFDYRIIIIVAIAFVLGYSYSGKPLQLGYYGMGELVIGAMFGPLLMSGVYLSACGTWDYSLLMVSLAVGLLVMNIVYGHSVMDAVADEAIGKMTFARLLKKKALMLTVSVLAIFVPFILIVLGVELFDMSRFNYFVFLALPMAASLVYYMYNFLYGAEILTRRFWWMGPMEKWVMVQEHGLTWFMLRWYLSRNLLSFFCVILLVVNLIV